MNTSNQLIQTSAAMSASGFSSTVVGGNGSSLFNNGHVAISKDMIFGLTLWDGETWVPLTELDADDLSMVRGLIAKGGNFLWQSELDNINPTI